MTVLEVKNLHVSLANDETHEILKGINLVIKTGEIHAIMGPNGTGKSTISETIMGNTNYLITEGEILVDGVVINDLKVDERARLGLFLAMQYPAEISGLTNTEFLRAAINARRAEDDQIPVMKFIQKLDDKMEILKMTEDLADRYLNVGFSGGEKKRNEILQLMMIEPQIAILDEIDSGLDIDALRVVADGVNSMRRPEFGTLIITHYQRLLNYIKPDFVHIIMDGKIVLTGDAELAKELEKTGYEHLLEDQEK